MTTKNLMLALLSVVFFAACSKDNNTDITNPDPDKNPNEYRPVKTMSIDDLVLYTTGQEHRDPKMIKDFMTRNFPDHVDHFQYGQTSVSDHGINTTMEFLENNRVKLNETVMEIVSKTDKEMLVSPLDSAKMPESSFLGHCMVLHTQVPQYNPYSICQGAGGNCKKYRPTYPIIISGKDYYLPLLKYAVKSNCNIFTYTSRPMPNYFNRNLLNGMVQNKDSVLVQVSRVQLTK